jgi:hypothetical protein
VLCYAFTLISKSRAKAFSFYNEEDDDDDVDMHKTSWSFFILQKHLNTHEGILVKFEPKIARVAHVF